MSKEPEFDIFISHASEDKDELARPLAETLVSLGLAVWYDETQISVGDSLVRSIDGGLTRSRYGIVILSKSFITKPWPEYELRGLVARSMGRSKNVLPIWYNITRDDILQFSPALADQAALQFPAHSIQQIALWIIKVVRPHLYENFYRAVLWRKKVSEAKIEWIDRAELKTGPIRHKALPLELAVRVRLVHAVLADVAFSPVEEVLENIRRDIDPSAEISIWERIAVAYSDLIRGQSLSMEARRYIAGELLYMSILDKEGLQEILDRGDNRQLAILEAWVSANSAPENA